MAHVYTYEKHDTFSATVDKKQCRAAVYNGAGGFRSSQCSRKAKVFDKEGLGWCTQHSPEKAAERKAKANVKANNWARKVDRAMAIKAIGEAYAGGMAESKKAAEAAAHATWRRNKKALDKSE